MIIGLGIDIVEIDRIRRSLGRFGQRFIEKILHESEIAGLYEFVSGAAGLPRQADPADESDPEKPGGLFSDPATAARLAARVAARFAAKEAGVKALGTGFSKGIGPTDIRILSLPSGQPALSLHGAARELADTLGVDGLHLSLSHGRDSACAVVVLEGNPDQYHRKYTP